MTYRSKSALLTNLASTLGSGSNITAAELRSFLTDLIDSTAGEGAFTTYTPAIDATGTAPTYTLETGSGFWGAGSYGWYKESGGMVDFGQRVVGTSVSDYGDGQWFLPMPVEPYSGAAPVGLSWIIDAAATGAPVYNTRCVIDPVYTTEGPMLFRTGDRFITGDDSDWICGVTDDEPNPPLVGTILIVTAFGRYRAA